MADLPCDPDGMCMVCKKVPLDEHVLLCSSCSSPWHLQCLNPPMSSVPVGDWDCPDCNMPPAPPTSLLPAPVPVSVTTGSENVILDKIRSIQADSSLTEVEKARKRQELMAHQASPAGGSAQEVKNEAGKQSKGRRNETLEMLDQNLNCIFCMQLAERPVTTPCGHNFCLKCFQRWIGQGKKNCGKCRAPIPSQMASQPRINSALVMAIRLAKSATTSGGIQGPPKPYHHIENEKRPDKCFTSERAVKTGKANACSGRIFVTIPPDHFGPILAENDPLRNQGVLVGESWEDRMECRQWGAHFPHVAGIAGQSDYGAQSVALSGGYEDDEDHGEWFLYTGSGGRDLSGNKRTNKEQSFDQKFDKSNEALRVSCKRGYPVRVVRSHKEKRSSYAPEKGVRYDGVYRIEKCWRKKGIQGHKVCRYLFVRCDNEPAPWTSDEHGDRQRPLPFIGELKEATDIFERKSSPSWDWMEDTGVWGWTKDRPESRKTTGGGGNSEKSSKRKHLTIQQKLLKEFGCGLCRKVMEQPLSTPCGHNFCKSCLVGVFAGQQDMRERTGVGGRSLRVQKVMKRCPTCKGDITDFVTCPQVNRQMEDLIQSLKNSVAEDDYEQEADLASCVDNLKETPSETAKGTDDDSESDPPQKSSERGSDSHVPAPVANGHKELPQVEDSIKMEPSSQHYNELVKSPGKLASAGQLEQSVGRTVVKDTDDDFSSDEGSTDDESPSKPRRKGNLRGVKRRKLVKKLHVGVSEKRNGRRRASVSDRGVNRKRNGPTHEVVTDSEESDQKPNNSGRRKLKGHDGLIVLDSEDEETNVSAVTPRRYTRSQHTAAVSAARKTSRSSGVSAQEIIEL